MKVPDWLPIFGDTTYRGPCPKETPEQITFFNQLREQYPAYGRVATHISNEGIRTKDETLKEIANGMVLGASDIIIPASPAFVCELKRKDHTKSSWQKGQLDYLKTAKSIGSFVCLALGYQGALEAVAYWHNAYHLHHKQYTHQSSD